MGYTHYWELNDAKPDDAFARLLFDTKVIIDEAGQRGIKIADGVGTPGTKPELSEGRIIFNGEQPDDYETFFLTQKGCGCDVKYHHFNFCKTAHRPYDAVVCAVLIRAKVHYGAGIQVSSDGDWDPDWVEAAKLCIDLFGEAVSSPLVPIEEIA
jgi:hypothetical protein